MIQYITESIAAMRAPMLVMRSGSVTTWTMNDGLIRVTKLGRKLLPEVIDLDTLKTYPILGVGSNRQTYRINRHTVAKYAKYHPDSNWMEVWTWQKLGHKKYGRKLAPVLGWTTDFQWVFMQYAPIVETICLEEWERGAESFHQWE